MIHNDDRRILIDWGDGDIWRSAKVIIAKKDCILGEHYHKEKLERFMLISGNAILNEQEMELYKVYDIPQNMVHTFEIKKDSILLGLGSEVFNPKDNYENNNTG